MAMRIISGHIPALPFAFGMVAMGVSLAKAPYRDHHRDRLARSGAEAGNGIRPNVGI